MAHLITNDAKVMVVDDDADFRELISDYLQGMGFQVIEAVDGDEAIRIAGQERPDVIFLDVMMPQKNGYDVCRDLKKDSRTSEATIVMLTVKNSVKDKLAAYIAGAQRFLDKATGLEDIDTCLRTVLHQRKIKHRQLPEDFI